MDHGSRRTRVEVLVGGTAKVASVLGGMAALAITGLVSLDVLMRYFVNAPLLFVDEIAGFLQLVIVFWGLAHTFRSGGHVRVDLVTSLLPPPARAWLRALTLAGGIAVLVVVIVVTWESTATAYRYGRVSSVMLYPLWVPMLLIPSGLALMALAMLVTLVRQVRVAVGPRGGRDEVQPSGHDG